VIPCGATECAPPEARETGNLPSMVDNRAYRAAKVPAVRSSGGALTVGVEEEFLLVDRSGRLSPRAPEVLVATEEPEGELQRELNLCQLESATAVCHDAGELLAQLRGMRRRLAAQASAHGLRLLPSGTPILAEDSPPAITPNARYRRMIDRYGALVTTVTACSCHVHVAVPDRSTGVLVCNHLRPWLPMLLALSANSPFHEGRDSRLCSWRHVQWGRWPSAGPPPFFRSLQHYECTVEAMLNSGAILDRGMIYWDIRLSEKQPTVELRICDVPASAAESALFGAIVRALVIVARHDIDDHRRPPRPPLELLRAHLWRAARDGLAGRCVHPATGNVVPVGAVAVFLVDHLRPALRNTGELDFVTDGLAGLIGAGCGAQRQRAAFAARHRLEDVVDMLTGQVAR
jgi:glutamate---cysteine ligase / carboxylate-amine ligase